MDRKNNNRKRSHLLIPELIKSLIFFLSLEYKYIENSEFYYFLLYFLFINILLLKIQKKIKRKLNSVSLIFKFH